MLVEQLMRDDAKDVVRSIITAAKQGDMIAARIITDRLAPLPKGRFLHIDVPKIEQPRDALPMVAGVLDAMAKGELTPHEARDIAGVVEVYLKVLEMVGLASEVADLKATMAAALQAQSQAQLQPSDAAAPKQAAE